MKSGQKGSRVGLTARRGARMSMKMGLSRKTFLYSSLLAVVMVAFVTGYFVFMLPSLYVNYVMERNLRSAEEIHKGYMSDRSYDRLAVTNPSATFSVEIPKEGDEIYAAGKFFRVTVQVQDRELMELLQEFRSLLGRLEEAGGTEQEELEAFSQEHISELWTETLKNKFVGEGMFPENYPVKVFFEGRENSGVYQEEYIKIHSLSGQVTVCEAGVSGGSFGYTTYVALGQTQDAFIITVLSTMTPRMEEIVPVVTESLPMIVAVVFFLVLMASRFFAGKIVQPIIRLAGQAGNIRLTGSCEMVSGADRGDEIGELAAALDELYLRLRDSYRELQEKNQMLEEEGERQEIFLRASSHQLKTPVAAALLLVDGMINEVGKYKNTKEYLPEVKKQLQSIRRLVDDILYLNDQAGNVQPEPVALEVLAGEILKTYEVQIENKRLRVAMAGQRMAFTDREMMWKIIDNLISNAVAYTPEGERIEIRIGEDGLCVQNYGVTIEEKLLPGIFKPFVSSTGQKGKGLGLYVAAYYGRLLGGTLQAENMENSVCVRLLMPLTAEE